MCGLFTVLPYSIAIQFGDGVDRRCVCSFVALFEWSLIGTVSSFSGTTAQNCQKTVSFSNKFQVLTVFE
jgi:hypothetical protein